MSNPSPNKKYQLANICLIDFTVIYVQLEMDLENGCPLLSFICSTDIFQFEFDGAPLNPDMDTGLPCHYFSEDAVNASSHTKMSSFFLRLGIGGKQKHGECKTASSILPRSGSSNTHMDAQLHTPLPTCAHYAQRSSCNVPSISDA